MKIVIRADSGTIMGSGHIMRGLVLADELFCSLSLWERVRVRVNNTDQEPSPQPSPIGRGSLIFACRSLPGNIVSVIESRGYAVKMLSDVLTAANKEFLQFIKQEQPEILIIDNYDTDIDLEKKVQKHAGSVVVIDDLANRKHECDILLDQNPCRETHDGYKNLVSEATVKLLGLKYALLGKEFAAHKKSFSDSQNKEIKNILIFFGGGDHKNLTEKVLNSISLWERAGVKVIQNLQQGEAIHYDVIVGISNPNKDKIRKLCEESKNFTYHCQIKNMPELMQKSDLFIGAGGTISWERMCVGLPGIIISIAGNQEEGCRSLAKLDVIKYLGTAEEFTPDKLLDTLKWIGENPEWLHKAGINSREMVDGYGAKRVAAAIISSQLELKKAGNEDCENIFNWRNSPENRLYSRNSNEINFTDHQKWFEKIINDQGHSLLVAYYNSQPIGVVRFDYARQAAEISIYLIPGRHGKGFGLLLLYAAEFWLTDNHSGIIEINAEVLPANTASIKIFAYALYNQTKSDKDIVILNKRLT